MNKLITSFVLVLLIMASGFAVVQAQNYSFNNDLTLGSSGQDVVNLQTWLITNGFDIPALADGVSKGYFGSQTQAAVAAYQQSRGLPAYGFFGPMTRAILNRGQSRGQSLKILSPNGGETWQIGTTHNISWATSAGLAGQIADIRLEFPLPVCAQPGQPIRCMIMTRAPYLIAKNVNLSPGSFAWRVGSVSDLSASVAYPGTSVATDGQYRVQICPTSGNCVESDNDFTISSSQTSGQSPVISGIDAPTTLAVNQTGTWTVHATDPLNGTLRYTVLWGDETALPQGMVGNVQQAVPFNQASTLTHTYSTAGTYTVQVTVFNAVGSAQTSAAVSIAGTNASAGPLKIISPNGGEVWQKGTTQTIRWNVNSSQISRLDLDLGQMLKVPCAYNVNSSVQTCPQQFQAQYNLDRNIAANAAYNWITATDINNMQIPAGTYYVRVCPAGTTLGCGVSAQAFTITSDATSGVPDINVVSPNGGEVWPAGSNQTVSVNVSGDPSQIGNLIEFYVVGQDNNPTLVQQVSFSQGGIQSFYVKVPSYIIGGQYRLLAKLYKLPAYSGGQTQYQAYDYSDNYFTITSMNSCPAGYTCMAMPSTP